MHIYIRYRYIQRERKRKIITIRRITKQTDTTLEETQKTPAQGKWVGWGLAQTQIEHQEHHNPLSEMIMFMFVLFNGCVCLYWIMWFCSSFSNVLWFLQDYKVYLYALRFYQAAIM